MTPSFTRRRSAPLVYEVRRREAGPHANVITASGELDLAAAPAIRDAVEELTDRGHADIVIDMSGATFIDSTVIGMLVGRLRELRAAGGSIALVCAEPNVLRTLEVAGVERVFTIRPALDDARPPA